MKTPVIVLSAHTMALGVIRALGVEGVPIAVVHYDARDFSHRSRYVRECFAAPHPEQQPDEFLQKLCNLPETWHGGVLFPVSDETLMFTARHKVELSRYFRVACPDFQTVRNLIDKQWTYPIAAQAGVGVPATRVFHTVDELIAHRDELMLPCLVKPSQSHLYFARFGVKMHLVNDWKQLLDNFSRARDAGLEVMVQEFIPGADDTVYNYNSFSVGGQPLAEFTAVHIRNAPPTFGSPRVAQSIKQPELLRQGRKLMEALNLTGYTCTEFKRDARDGRFKLMEVNGRHNLSTSLSVKCGINFPLIEYAYRTHAELPSTCDFKAGIYWIDLTRDLAYSIQYLRTEGYSVAQYLRPYRNEKAWAILDLHDLRPILRRVGNLLLGGALVSIRNNSGRMASVEKPLAKDRVV